MENKKDQKKEKDMELKELCRVMGPVEAAVIKSFLESNGIACLMRGTWVQSVAPMSTDGLGEIRILVAETDYAVAKELLENKPGGQEQ
jgi:hypothetical protein